MRIRRAKFGGCIQNRNRLNAQAVRDAGLFGSFASVRLWPRASTVLFRWFCPSAVLRKSMKWSRGRFTPLMPVRSKGAQDPPSLTIGSVAGPGNSGAFTTGRVTCTCPMSGSLLTVSSLLESSFESYTLRPLSVRPWPCSYPPVNFMFCDL